MTSRKATVICRVTPNTTDLLVETQDRVRSQW